MPTVSIFPNAPPTKLSTSSKLCSKQRAVHRSAEFSKTAQLQIHARSSVRARSRSLKNLLPRKTVRLLFLTMSCPLRKYVHFPKISAYASLTAPPLYSIYLHSAPEPVKAAFRLSLHNINIYCRALQVCGHISYARQPAAVLRL